MSLFVTLALDSPVYDGQKVTKCLEQVKGCVNGQRRKVKVVTVTRNAISMAVAYLIA